MDVFFFKFRWCFGLGGRPGRALAGLRPAGSVGWPACLCARPGRGRVEAGPFGRLAGLHPSRGRVQAGHWPAGSGACPARPGLGRGKAEAAGSPFPLV